MEDIQRAGNFEYLTRILAHNTERPPESRWYRLRGPRIENLDLGTTPISQAEIWQWRRNDFLISLLIEIWQNECRQGWSLFFMEQPHFASMDLLSNGIMVPHYRSMMVFSRRAQNEA